VESSNCFELASIARAIAISESGDPNALNYKIYDKVI